MMMRLYVFFTLFALTCIYALARGGAPERYMVGVLVMGLAGTLILRAPFETRFGTFDAGIFLTDAVMLGAILAMALNAERFWPLWMSAFQMIQVLSHLPETLIPNLLPRTYLVIVSVWSYPMLLLLVLGTLRHRRRLATQTIDRSWSDFSGQHATNSR